MGEMGFRDSAAPRAGLFLPVVFYLPWYGVSTCPPSKKPRKRPVEGQLRRGATDLAKKQSPALAGHLRGK